jgi:hypothetical protein
LVPAPRQQSLDVTATRTAILPIGVDNLETQPDAVVVGSDQLQQWGALATDDKLRKVVGFSLLRISASQTANPTSQGVSLRGLGASGASRALVLTKLDDAAQRNLIITLPDQPPIQVDNLEVAQFHWCPAKFPSWHIGLIES